MADMREDPLLVSQDIGIRAGGVYPGKLCYCKLRTEGAYMGKVLKEVTERLT